MARRTCTVENCDKPVQGRGYCPTHYRRWWRNGHPTENGHVKVVDHPNGDRTCKACGQRKTPAAFAKKADMARGIHSRCRECVAAAERERRLTDIDSHRARKAANEMKRRALRLGSQATEHITREALRGELGDYCAYCGQAMDFGTYTRTTRPSTLATVDHILPLSKGGEHIRANVVLCCLGCNLSKGNRPAPARTAS